MSLPTSLKAYDECRDLFDQALADPKGARACLETYDACVGMRTRMHYFRKLDREANEKTYPVNHPMHGTSIYDVLEVRIIPDEDNRFWLYVTPRTGKITVVEGLSDVPDLIDVQPETEANGQT